MIQKPKKLILAMMAWGFAFALGVPASADVSAADRKAAGALFDQGRVLIKEGKPAEACPKFAESMRLDPGVGTLYNLADCYERIGRTASAWTGFVEVVKRAKESKQAEREKLAQERVDALEPKLTRLVIWVPDRARVNGIEVRRDYVGVPLSEWDVPIPVNPGGPHTITAAAPGYVPWKLQVDVTGGTTSEVTIMLRKEPLPPPRSEPYSTGMRAGGILLIVLGSVGATAGAITAAVSPYIATIGLGALGGSHALLIPGIVLTSVGGHRVPVDNKPYSTGMRAGGIVLTVLGSMMAAAGAIIAGFDDSAGAGLGIMGVSHTLLIPGIVLTSVGGRSVPVDTAVRSRQPVPVFTPSLTGFKVSF